MRFTSLACTVTALVLTTIDTRAAGDDVDKPGIANPKTYLAEVGTLLDKTWPANRMVKIVCHGHSVPAGYFKTPVVDTFNSYPHLLHERIKSQHPYAVVNVIVTAVGGENSISGARRFDADVLALKPDVVLIDYALNDRGAGLEKAKEAWTEMIAKAKAARVKVVLLTPTGDLSAKLDDPNDKLNQHAEQIRALAAEHHVALVDSLAAFHACVRTGGKPADLMSQGNHPNRRGHDLVASEAMKWFPASPKPLTKSTHVFKTVSVPATEGRPAQEVKVEADVYQPEGTHLRPVVVWIHGGALIVGGRDSVPKNILDLCTRERYIVVSLDYRLAPEVKMPEIAADIRDAFHWLHAEGPKLFQADVNRIVVAGGSAGGYLTMLAGATVEPKPAALVAYWGYGDLDGAWATSASTHHGPKVTEAELAEAQSVIGKEILTNTHDPKLGKSRGYYYRNLRQTGGWSREVSGIDAAKEPGKLDPYCPVKQISPQYPPILMIHGTADTDVAYSCSTDMAAQLAKHGVAHELISIPNAEHGLRDGDPKLINYAQTRALDYIRSALRR